MAIDGMNPAAAAGAYASIQKAAQGGGVSAGEGQSFGSVLRDSIAEGIGTLREGEKMSAGAVTGKADVNAVVMAVTQAEMTVSKMTAYRDAAANAYQEIMRMPI